MTPNSARRWQEKRERSAELGRLMARPRSFLHDSPNQGLQPLGLREERDGLIYIPIGYRPEQPAPMALMLHGAGGNAFHALAPFLNFADQHGLVLVAPESIGTSWDFLRGGYGPDVDFIDQTLEYVFERCAVLPRRIAIQGFSDGASYALSLGITNGDLFSHIIAFSPGFLAPIGQTDSPRIYIAHGMNDRVLPIDASSRKAVPSLVNGGYDVTYREFDGSHAVPLEIAEEALDWFLYDRRFRNDETSIRPDIRPARKRAAG